MERQYRFSFSMYQEQEEHLGEKLKIGEIEDIMSRIGEIDKIDVQEGNQGPVYHVKYENKSIAIGLPFIKTNIETNESEILEIIEAIDNVVDLATDKADELEYNGEISIVGEIKMKKKLFNDIEPPVDEYKDMSALAFSRLYNGNTYGISVNESDGEKLSLNISFPFETVPEEEGSITIEEATEDLFKLFREIEEEISDN